MRSSLVIETLCRQNIGKQVTVTCLYCDFNCHKEHSTAHILDSILKQVISGWENIPLEVEVAFQKSENELGGRGLGLAGVLKLLISTLRTLKRSYICIDALDEFPREYRPELFRSLVHITRESLGTRLFVTGRQHVREEVGRYFVGGAEMRFIPSEEDIEIYLTIRLSNDTQSRVMNDSLRAEILTTIPEKISEMYVTDIRALRTLFMGYSLIRFQISTSFVRHERSINTVNYSREEKYA